MNSESDPNFTSETIPDKSLHSNDNSSANPNSASENADDSVVRTDSKMTKIVVWGGLVIVLVGLLMVFSAGEQHPMMMIIGILLTAVGVFTTVIAKFYTWWKNA